MRLAELARDSMVLRSQLTDPAFDLKSLHSDSRRVGAGTGFFALRGFTTDGHRFVDAALAAGAPVLFVSDSGIFERLATTLPPSVSGVFQVPPGREVLADLAEAVYGEPGRQLTLAGVTGTNGKTTVTHLCAQLLDALHRPNALLGTLGGWIGGETFGGAHTTPEAPDIQAFLRLCVERGAGLVAMEVSSHGIALERTRGLSFSAAAFTNLTRDHLDFHGDLETYREIKFRLFTEYETGCAVINGDDPAGRLLERRLAASRPGQRRIVFGLQAPADLTISGLEAGPGGTRGELCWEGHRAPFHMPLRGSFNALNLLGAVGLLLANGEPLAGLAAAARACRGAPGRFERMDIATPFAVVVDYAHTPDALENLLGAARALTEGKLRVLFGCGGGRDRGKRPQMGAIAHRLADQVVLTDDNPRDEPSSAILAEIAAGMGSGASYDLIPDRSEAIFALLDQAEAGDMVVLAGKGDESTQEVGGEKHSFDDRRVVRQWAARRGLAGGA